MGKQLSVSKIPYLRDGPDGKPGRAWQIITGCTPVSSGCKHCWAQTTIRRFGKALGHDPAGPAVQVHEDRFEQPQMTPGQHTVFVAPMGDLFHEDVPTRFIQDVFETMGLPENQKHHFLLLTKRPERIARVLWGEESNWFMGGGDFEPNVWLGVSVEDQATADERLPVLAEIDWPHKWLSVEPCIGPVSLRAPRLGHRYGRSQVETVILGCENGPGARPFDEEWAQILQQECEQTGATFYYKQAPDPARKGAVIEHPFLDGRQWTEVPWGGGP
jgi:protein gp37